MKTSVDIEQEACEQIGQDLFRVLSDNYILYLKTQNFHWNVVDRRFHSLHEMFEEQYKALAEANDELAERIRMLKLKTPATMNQFLKSGTLAEADEEISGDDMLRTLVHDREALIKFIRPKIEEAGRLGDEGTADLLIQHLKMHEKAAWMLRSHLD